jgi:mannose-1-phosphate guanylyltransferase/mannose-1-phosphate guanylyltransferase/mannose-6-phosphate isomerase
MAGGYGTRLWPASNSRKPKQFLPAVKDGTESFLSLSLERAFRLVPENDGRVIVIMGKSHLPFVIAACSELSAAEKKRLVLIPEPEAKNTAPAIACAIVYAGNTGGWNRTMMVLTSDHIIKPLDAFFKDASIGAQFAEQDKLVVFGISPLGPETGYGYIETAEKPAVEPAERPAENTYNVAAFREKPDRKTAEQFLASKKYFWNSGMFAFCCDFLSVEYRHLAAEVIGPFEKIKAPDKDSYTKVEGFCVLDTWTGLDKAYNLTKSISFDYAIAEKCSKTVMIRASFDWIDIGSWDDYARLLSGNSAANSDNGKDVYTIGTSGCFVDSDISVALAGVEDLIVVIRSGKDGFPPAALITQKGKTQLVRDIVEKIKQTDNKDIL